MTITMFFIAQAITGDVLPMPWGIITIFGIYVALWLEEVFEVVEYRLAHKESILLIFLVALFTYVIFSFNTPEHFFETPDNYTWTLKLEAHNLSKRAF